MRMQASALIFSLCAARLQWLVLQVAQQEPAVTAGQQGGAPRLLRGGHSGLDFAMQPDRPQFWLTLQLPSGHRSSPTPLLTIRCMGMGWELLDACTICAYQLPTARDGRERVRPPGGEGGWLGHAPSIKLCCSEGRPCPKPKRAEWTQMLILGFSMAA